MPEAKPKDLRSRARIAALQSLFAAEVKGAGAEASLGWLAQEDLLQGEIVRFATSLIRGVGRRKPDLDNMIHLYAPAWPVSQLSLIDRNILRIALFEILHTREVSNKTAINEAVELAKAFGSDSSARFINGVLGSVIDKLDEEAMTPSITQQKGG